jgi:uncharacterized membrane protein
MSSKKYDTNPLDHDVKKTADERMGIVDEDSTTAELPTAEIPGSPRNAAESETRNISDFNTGTPAPRPTSGQGFNPPTRAANPMTQGEIQPPGTGPAYLPPSSGSIGSSAGYPSPNTGVPPNQMPGYQSQRPVYQPGYQSTGGYNPQYPPPYAPVSPGVRPQVPYGRSYVNRGLGLDPNIESALCYVPWLGWIMSVLILAKEPKTNMFARYHAFQALMLHVGMTAIGLIFKIPGSMGPALGAPWISVLFGGLESLIGIVAFFGFIFLGIMAFQMKTVKIPYLSEIVEKYNPK